MNVLVWGLGYVGAITAACLAERGHLVIGVDTDTAKVAEVNGGRAPVREPGLDETVRRGVARGSLRAVTDREGEALVAGADVSLVCVGTPGDAEGRTETRALEAVARAVGRGLRGSESYHVVAVRSTVWPGVTAGLIRGILEAESGKRTGRDFGLAMNPEFLREGCGLQDFLAPPCHVIGEWDARSGDAVAALYEGPSESASTPSHRVPLEEAETLKLVGNSFHALKVGFANEVGRLCAALGVDADSVMQGVCADTTLNISPHYLQPGAAFGGSCLPKDLRSLLHGAGSLGVSLPILGAVLPSNDLILQDTVERVRVLGVGRVCALGVSFKPGTDDLRGSPALELICRLRDAGLTVRAFDSDVDPDRLLDSNLRYLQQRLPDHAAVLRPALPDALHGAEAVVIGKAIPPSLERYARDFVGDAVPVIRASSVADGPSLP